MGPSEKLSEGHLGDNIRDLRITIPNESSVGGQARNAACAQDHFFISACSMSTGTGKTTVVFFSTPISVRVCR